MLNIGDLFTHPQLRDRVLKVTERQPDGARTLLTANIVVNNAVGRQTYHFWEHECVAVKIKPKSLMSW